MGFCLVNFALGDKEEGGGKEKGPPGNRFPGGPQRQESLRAYFLARMNFQGCWFIGFPYQPSHFVRSIMFWVT